MNVDTSRVPTRNDVPVVDEKLVALRTFLICICMAFTESWKLTGDGAGE